MSFASFPALTASGISRCRIRIDIEAPEIFLAMTLFLIGGGYLMRPQRFPVQVMKEPGKINNDSGWCQDELANYVGPRLGYQVTIIDK